MELLNRHIIDIKRILDCNYKGRIIPPCFYKSICLVSIFPVSISPFNLALLYSFKTAIELSSDHGSIWGFITKHRILTSSSLRYVIIKYFVVVLTFLSFARPQ